jgi:hypothetical protein
MFGFYYMAEEDGAPIGQGIVQPEVKEPEAPAPEAHAPEAPKYTDKQLNDLIAKEVAKRESGMLKKYGIENEDALAELKKIREEKMTEAERMALAIKERDTAITQAKAEADSARAEVECLKRGVNAEKVSRLIKIANTYDGVSIAEKIELAMKDFPEFAAKAPAPVPANLGTETKSEGMSEVETLLALARKNAGLTK